WYRHALSELLRHATVEDRAAVLALPHLADAALLVEVDVGEAAHGDGQRRVLASVGGHEHHIGHADQLLLDRAGRLCLCLRHESLYLFLRFAVFADRAAGFADRFSALAGRAALVGRAGLVLP